MSASPPTATTSGHRVGSLADIPPGEGRAYAVEGDRVAVFHLRDGTLRAVSAVCPHAGGPLADGQIDTEVVVCPLHLNVFELASGESRTGQRPLRTYRVELDGDDVLVHLPAPDR